MIDLSLADWREKTAALYLSDLDLAGFRAERDAMYRDHPQSPVADRDAFTGIGWFPPSSFRCESTLQPADDGSTLDVDTGGDDGVVRYRRLGRLATPWGQLTLFWILAYGGGLFLPFRDATAGTSTYGAGRYLTDTVKGTFGRGLTLLGDDRVRLDFDYAYHPSCAWNSAWACPLAPPENHLDVAIEAGERLH